MGPLTLPPHHNDKTNLHPPLLLLFGCGFKCADTVVATIPSCNAQLTTTLFTRDCGATTLENTQIIISPASQPFAPKHQSSIFIIEPEGPVTAQWTSPHKSSDRYTGCRKKFPNGRSDFGLRQGGDRRRYLEDNAKADNAASNQKHPAPMTNELPPP